MVKKIKVNYIIKEIQKQSPYSNSEEEDKLVLNIVDLKSQKKKSQK